MVEGHYTPEEEQAIVDKWLAEQGSVFPFESIEDLFTSPRGFGITTATPLQRACCRIIEGIPLGDLMDEPTVQRALGVEQLEQNGKPAEIDILAAVRCGKSMIIAAAALWASQHCSFKKCTTTEIPRYSIVSVEKDNAAVTYGHLVGVLQKPDLQHLRVDEKQATEWAELMKETGVGYTGYCFLWHPSGRPVEIRVTAGKRAGSGLVSRWCVGLCLDEAPRMLGQDEAVVNYDEARKAVRARLLRGAQIFSIGSPWRAQGPMYERWLKYWGSPTARRVCMKAPGPVMNPYHWTPQLVAEIKEEDPDVYKTDCMAEFLEPVEALISPIIVNRNVRKEPQTIEYSPAGTYTARMDPATRGNGWTFAIATRVGRRKKVVYNKEWRGTAIDPLNSRMVLTEVAGALRTYRLTYVRTDQYCSDTIRDIADELADEHGDSIRFDVIRDQWGSEESRKMYQNFRDEMTDNMVELPPDPQVAADIRMIQKRKTSNSFTIALPKTGDGRHCDYAPTIVGLLKPWIDEDVELPPGEDEEGYNEYLEEKMEAAELEAWDREQEQEWWEREDYYV